jgi:hypothetical protein
MKRYIKAAHVNDADPRQPLISAVTLVLGLSFTGNSSELQWSERFDRWLDYTIRSGTSIGPNKYKITIHQASEPDAWHVDPADPDIVGAVAQFIQRTYSDLNVIANTRYGFVVCDQYLADKSVEAVAKQLFDRVSQLLGGVHRERMLEVKNYKAYSDHVAITASVSLLLSDTELQEEVDFVRDVLESDGLDVESIKVTKGRMQYPSYWMDHRLTINLLYS